MANIKTNLSEVLENAVAALDYELVGFEFEPRRHRALLRIYIDKPGGINVADCARASRHIAGVLDVEDLLHGPYNLEVSSPGIERPLFVIAHFQRYVGEQVDIKLKTPVEGRRTLVGTITEVSGDRITITTTDSRQYHILHENIQKAHLIEGKKD